MIDPDVFQAFSSLYIQSRKKETDFILQKDRDQRFTGGELEVIRQIIKDEYKAGKTQEEIGQLVGLSQIAISYHLKQMNIKINHVIKK